LLNKRKEATKATAAIAKCTVTPFCERHHNASAAHRPYCRVRAGFKKISEV